MAEQQFDLLSDDAEFEQLMQELEALPADQREQAVQQIPATLQTLIALFVSELEPLVKRPEKVAQRLVLRLATMMDGKYTYLPRTDKLKNALRDIEIYNKHNRGCTVQELALQYKLTTTQIYNILRNQLQAYKARRQLELFKG